MAYFKCHFTLHISPLIDIYISQLLKIFLLFVIHNIEVKLIIGKVQSKIFLFESINIFMFV